MTPSQQETEIYISLGGNIGDPSMTIDDALSNLAAQPGISVHTRSPFYRTPPWGKTDQAEFVNACAKLATTLTPKALLETCLRVEKQMGRERGERWGPRIIDIDILTFGAKEISLPDLTIPHPLIAERAFVLVPLRDIAPDFILAGRSIAQMLEKLDIKGIEPLEPLLETI